MADEGSVATLEAPGADASLDTTTSTDTGITSSDTSGSGDTGTSDAIDNADSPAAGETGHLRGAELFKSVKDKLRKGEALSPQEYRSIRNAVHMADKADRLTGGNLDALESQNGLMAKLTDDPDAGHTPEQIIENTLAERTFWRGFDDKFQKAAESPADAQALIQEMFTANPMSAQQMAVHAMDEFAKVNGEAFSGYVAKSTVGYFNGKQVPLQFAILETFLPSLPDFPGKERVVAAIQSIYGAFEGLNTMAQNPVTPKKLEGTPEAAGGMNQGENTTEALTIRANRAEWQPQAQQKGIELRTTEMNRIAAAQKVTLTAEDQQKIRAAVNEEVNTRLSVDQRYIQAMKGFLIAGNRKAYIERATSEQQKIVPGITRRHTQALIEEKKATPAKAAVNGSGAAAKAAQAAPSKDGNGNLIQFIAGSPKSVGLQVDHGRTTHSMLMRNEAYIVGQKAMVRWKPKTV
jgi:hypothetical protein